MVNACFVFGCTSNSKKNPELKFHPLPKNVQVRQQWIIKLKTYRHSYHAKSLKVCSLHFEDEHYAFTILGEKWNLKKDAVPTKKLPGARKAVNERPNKYGKRNVLSIVNDVPEALGPDIEIEAIEVEAIAEKAEQSPQKKNQATQTFLDFANENCEEEKAMNGNCSQKSVDKLDDPNFFYFCGLHREVFEYLYELCTDGEDDVPHASQLSSENQLFFTLYVYKHALDLKFVSFDLNISAKLGSKIFEHWTLILNAKLKSFDVWHKVRANLAANEYTCIIDCTEIACDIPGQPDTQQQTFSSYKNVNTLKGLVGCNEDGVVMFCSQLYTGSISDDDITKDSGFLEHLLPGDFICADKGFNVGELLASAKVGLNVPPFKKNNKLSEMEIALSKAITNKRIVIENVIGEAKKFKIIHSRLSRHLHHLASQIFQNCVLLCNFKRPRRK